MHFDVGKPIRVTRLGVFDSGGDGLLLTITASLYNRQTEALVASLVFTPEDPGELIGGSRFKSLAIPLVLAAGFEGTMSASGYGDEEMNGNTLGALDPVWTTFGGGAIAFVGGGSYGDDPTIFPPSPTAAPQTAMRAEHSPSSRMRRPEADDPVGRGRSATELGSADGFVGTQWDAAAGFLGTGAWRHEWHRRPPDHSGGILPHHPVANDEASGTGCSLALPDVRR